MNKDYNNRNYVGSTEIRPNDSHVSFYKKCFDMFDGRYHVCYSYGTPVLVWDTESDELIRTWCDSSNTTMRHIRAWMYWLNIGTMSIGEYRKMEVQDTPQPWMCRYTFANKRTHNPWWSDFYDTDY